MVPNIRSINSASYSLSEFVEGFCGRVVNISRSGSSEVSRSFYERIAVRPFAMIPYLKVGCDLYQLTLCG